MKRYTVRVRREGEAADLGEARRAVEGALLYAPVAYRVCAAIPSEDGSFQVGLVSDAGRERIVALLDALDAAAWHIEVVEWGWPEVLARTVTAEDTHGCGAPDPYAGSSAQVEETREYGWGRRQVLKLASSFGIVLLLASGFVLAATRRLDSDLAFILYFPFYVLLLSIVGMPWTRYPYISRVVCGPKGLSVVYRFLRTRRTARWEEIAALQVIQPGGVGRLTCGRGALKLPLGSLPAQEQRTLVRTIVERASLRFVEGAALGTAEYRWAAPRVPIRPAQPATG